MRKMLVAGGVLACGLGLFTGNGVAQTPAPAPAPAAPPAATPEPSAAEYASRPVALIYGNVPVTRQQLGEFLIARGGADKIDLLVNKLIIEHECKKRNITVTPQEMEAALMEDLEGLSASGGVIAKADFVKAILPRYGKTLYEWMEDVVKPRLLLGKMCRDRVKIEDADLKVQFEREFGEKRKVQIIMWPLGDDLKTIDKMYGKLRDSQAEFDSAARAQANPSLAATAGYIKPISRHLYANDKIVEEVAFQLKPGEVSQVLKTTQGFLVMKLHEVLPADATAKFEQHQPRLHKQAFDEKMAQEIPKLFAELKKDAVPKPLFDGPAEWRFNAAPVTPVSGTALQGVAPKPTQPPAPVETATPMPMK